MSIFETFMKKIIYIAIIFFVKKALAGCSYFKSLMVFKNFSD